MFWGMLHVVSKLPGKSIQGYLAMYPRINGQVSKDMSFLDFTSIFSRFHWFFCNLVEEDMF